MNDLPSVVHGCQLNMYADDMELHCSNSDLLLAQHGLQNDLNSIEFWLRTNQLSLNVGKSHVMLIGSRQKLITAWTSSSIADLSNGDSPSMQLQKDHVL